MKRIRLSIFTFLTLIMGIVCVNAASISVKTNATNVTVGKSITVTVSVSGDDADSWEYDLNYDSSMFTLSSSSNHVLGGALAGNRDVSFTLKANKSGTSTIGVKNVSVQNYLAENLTVNPNTVKVTAKTQAEIEANYSNNADLKLLDVDNYDISPAFNKDTLEYSLEVPNEVETIVIRATKADNSARISGAGEKTLLEGNNKFEIVVTAEKGNKKTYILNVVRKELNPIKRTVNGNEYTIIRKVENVEAPSYYALDMVVIDGEDVPAYKSEITGYTLLAVKDEEGNVSFFRYENGELYSYIQLNMEVFIFIAEETSDKVSGYDIEKEITINDVKIKGYVSNVDSEFILLYGMNANTGEKGWYVYDSKEKTFQRYNSESTPVVAVEESNDLYFLLTIVFAGIGAVSIILLIIVMSKNTKLRRNNERLVGFLENKKEKREQKIEARFDTFSDRDEEERKKLDQTIHMEDTEEELKTLEEVEAEREAAKKEEIKKEVAKMIEEQKEETEAETEEIDDSYDNETEILEEINGREEEPKDLKQRMKNDRQVKNELLDKVMRESRNINKPLDEESEEIEKIIEDSYDEGDENVSKRELRRIEKQRRHDEKEEIKRMQEDFLSTDEYTIEEEKIIEEEPEENDIVQVEESQISEPVITQKKKKKKKKRK